MGKKRKIINSTKYARKYANHPLARARAAAGVVAGSVVDVAEDVVEAAAEVVETVAEDVTQVTQDVVSSSERKEVKKKTSSRRKSKKV